MYLNPITNPLNVQILGGILSVNFPFTVRLLIFAFTTPMSQIFLRGNNDVVAGAGFSAQSSAGLYSIQSSVAPVKV